MSYACAVLTEQLRECVRKRISRRKAVENAAWAVAWGAILTGLLCLGVR